MLNMSRKNSGGVAMDYNNMLTKNNLKGGEAVGGQRKLKRTTKGNINSANLYVAKASSP